MKLNKNKPKKFRSYAMSTKSKKIKKNHKSKPKNKKQNNTTYIFDNTVNRSKCFRNTSSLISELKGFGHKPDPLINATIKSTKPSLETFHHFVKES